MSIAGLYLAAAALVAVAGLAKVLAPDASRVALRTVGLPSSPLAVRTLGVVELGLAAAALVVGGAPAALGIALAYLGFAGFAALVARRSRYRAPCGCFGRSEAPIGPLHVGVDLALAAVALVAATGPVGSLLTEARATPAAGVPFVGYTLLLTWLLVVLLTALPELQAATAPTKRAVP